MPATRPALFVRSFRKKYPAAVRGEGVYLWDEGGNGYLDFAGSAAVNFIGHGDGQIAQAMAQQAGTLEFAHSSQFTTPVGEQFAREVLAFAGFPGGAVFFTCGGSEAVETALKLVRQYQVEKGEKNRIGILSREQAYHGSTLGALGVSGNRRRRELYLPMVRDSARVSIPYCYRCKYGCRDCRQGYAQELEKELTERGQTTAAFIFEPVSGATLGAAVPPDGYLQDVVEICWRYGVLTIADEVMTGFGRTGRNLGVDHGGVKPDIVVLGKGIASGYAPLGAVVASKHVVDAIVQGSGAFVHGFTYNAHPVSVAAGRAVLQRIKENDLVSSAASDAGGTAGSMLKSQLRSLCDCRSVGDVRGIGLLWAMEFVSNKDSKAPFAPDVGFAQQIGEVATGKGLMLYPMQGCVDGISGDHILIAPPAVITQEQIGWAVARLRESIEEVEKSAPFA
jgi:adenosylmethionine-8-amino-7-oxononanoate aminotransferase